MKNEVQEWKTRQVYVSASSLQVIGRWTGTKEDVLNLEYNETGLGPRLRLCFTDNNNNTKNQVLFYLQDPSNDWRVNETYRYKLTNSWISSPITTKSSTEAERNITNSDDQEGGKGILSIAGSSWYFWNPNSFIDSDLRIPIGYDGFTCEYVELPYWTLLKKSASDTESDVIPEARIQISDFTIGFSSMLDYDNPNLRRIYNPCQDSGHGKCLIMDGRVTCGSALYWQYGTLCFGLLMLVCFFYCFVRNCLGNRSGDDFVLYERVAWSNDADKEDDKYYFDDDDKNEIENSDHKADHKMIEMTTWGEYDSLREDFQDESTEKK